MFAGCYSATPIGEDVLERDTQSTQPSQSTKFGKATSSVWRNIFPWNNNSTSNFFLSEHGTVEAVSTQSSFVRRRSSTKHAASLLQRRTDETDRGVDVRAYSAPRQRTMWTRQSFVRRTRGESTLFEQLESGVRPWKSTNLASAADSTDTSETTPTLPSETSLRSGKLSAHRRGHSAISSARYLHKLALTRNEAKSVLDNADCESPAQEFVPETSKKELKIFLSCRARNFSDSRVNNASATATAARGKTAPPMTIAVVSPPRLSGVSLSGVDVSSSASTTKAATALAAATPATLGAARDRPESLNGSAGGTIAVAPFRRGSSSMWCVHKEVGTTTTATPAGNWSKRSPLVSSRTDTSPFICNRSVGSTSAGESTAETTGARQPDLHRGMKQAERGVVTSGTDAESPNRCVRLSKARQEPVPSSPPLLKARTVFDSTPVPMLRLSEQSQGRYSNQPPSKESTNRVGSEILMAEANVFQETEVTQKSCAEDEAAAGLIKHNTVETRQYRLDRGESRYAINNRRRLRAPGENFTTSHIDGAVARENKCVPKSKVKSWSASDGISPQYCSPRRDPNTSKNDSRDSHTSCAAPGIPPKCSGLVSAMSNVNRRGRDNNEGGGQQLEVSFHKSGHGHSSGAALHRAGLAKRTDLHSRHSLASNSSISSPQDTHSETLEDSPGGVVHVIETQVTPRCRRDTCAEPSMEGSSASSLTPILIRIHHAADNDISQCDPHPELASRKLKISSVDDSSHSATAGGTAASKGEGSVRNTPGASNTSVFQRTDWKPTGLRHTVARKKAGLTLSESILVKERAASKLSSFKSFRRTASSLGALDSWWNEHPVVQSISQDPRIVNSVVDISTDPETCLDWALKLMRCFAVESVKGAEVIWVDSPTGDRRLASLHISRDLQSFSILERDTAAVTTIFLRNVHGSYNSTDLKRIPKLRSLASMPGIMNLTDVERDLLLVIEYVDSTQYLQRVCLILDEEFACYDVEPPVQPVQSVATSIKLFSLLSQPATPRP